MFFQRLKTPGLGHNSYVVDCGDGQAVVIDPRRDVEDYLRLARENNLSIAYILETHRQEDFEFGSATIAKMNGAKIVSGCHQLFGNTDIQLKDGEVLELGTTRFEILETPGHTPESITYATYLEDSGEHYWGAFTDDALFVGDTGRTDLTDPEKTGENAGILYDSIHTKGAPLGDQTLLYPAHGAGSACGGYISDRDDSTLGIEKSTNPVFKKSRSEFIEHKLAEDMARPPHFLHMEEMNLLPGRPLPSPKSFHILQPEEFQQRMQEGLVIDTREQGLPIETLGTTSAREAAQWCQQGQVMVLDVRDEYEWNEKHIPGAIHRFVGYLEGDLPQLPTDSKIVVHCNVGHRSGVAVSILKRHGFTRVHNMLGGLKAWESLDLPLEKAAKTDKAEKAG